MLSFFFFPVESVFLREAGQLAANAPAPALDVSRRLQSKALLLYHRRKAHHPAGKQRSKNNLIRLQLCWSKGFSAEFISDGTEGIGDQTQNMNLLHLLFVFVCIFFQLYFSPSKLDKKFIQQNVDVSAVLSQNTNFFLRRLSRSSFEGILTCVETCHCGLLLQINSLFIRQQTTRNSLPRDDWVGRWLLAEPQRVTPLNAGTAHYKDRSKDKDKESINRNQGSVREKPDVRNR